MAGFYKGVALFVLGLAVGLPARAQLGTSANPPPQQLFETDHPQRLNTGLGTMAERQPRPAPVKRAVRRVHRTR